MIPPKRGFSIIEVVLVIGIAGLIFMMAFIALPSLWASQRDAERRANVMEFITTLKNYTTNNSRGALPTLSTDPMTFTREEARTYAAGTDKSSWKLFVKDYLKTDFKDPTNDSIDKFHFTITNCTTVAGSNACAGTLATVNGVSIPGSVDSTLYVAVGAKCDGDQAVKSANNRDVAAVYILERSGRYCYNN